MLTYIGTNTGRKLKGIESLSQTMITTFILSYEFDQIVKVLKFPRCTLFSFMEYRKY